MTRSCIHELCALHGLCSLPAALWFLHVCLHFSVVHIKMLPASLSSLASANLELCYESTSIIYIHIYILQTVLFRPSGPHQCSADAEMKVKV